jgi:hypothetical protein
MLGRSDGEAGGGEKRAGLLNPQPASRTGSTQSVSQSASEVDEDDGWVITPGAKKEPLSHQQSSGNARRVWLEPTSSEESLPLEGARKLDTSIGKASPVPAQLPTPSSADDVFHSATSLPVVQVENRESDAMPALVEQPSLPEDEPTNADKERAFKMFNNDDPTVQASQVATVLGDVTLSSIRMRKAYMDLFDWSGFSILAAMRDLCGKLVLKAETQQVDRILMSLSERWCECNPNHGFKSTGKIIYYAIGSRFSHQ